MNSLGGGALVVRRDEAAEPDWESIWKELGRSSDRAAVIVGHALLEESLGRLLRSHFVDDPKVAARVVEPGDRSIGLKRGADLAYCLGLVTAFELEELRAVADLRNHFAHLVEATSLDDSFATRHMQRLLRNRRFMKRLDECSHERFAVAVTILFFDLESRARDAQHLEQRGPGDEQHLQRRLWLQQLQDSVE